jgi:hypothetical protein
MGKQSKKKGPKQRPAHKQADGERQGTSDVFGGIGGVGRDQENDRSGGGAGSPEGQGRPDEHR